MWRVTIKGLLAHKFRLGATALAIVLGVGFVSGTYILTDTMNRAFDDLFKQVNKGIAVQVSGVSKFKATGPGGQDSGTPERIPANLLPTIRQVDGVKTAEGSLAGYAQLVDKDGKAISTGGAPTLGVSAQNDPELSGVSIRAGRYPEKSGEIGIDAQTARKHDFKVGDRTTVLLQGPPMQVTIVGIFGFGEADNLGGATLVAFDPQTAQVALNGGGKFDSIDASAQPGVSPNELRDRIQKILPQGYEAKTGAQAAEDNSNDVKDALSFFNIALLVFAGIALFVGAFLIFNTFSILITQRTRELALLRALGATAKQVRRSVIIEATVVGIVASLAGLGFGFVIAIGLQGLLKVFGIDLPSTSLQLLPRTIIASMLVGTVTTVVSSLMPSVRASRVPPVAAMRETMPTEYRRSSRRTISGLIVTALGVLALLGGLFGNGGAALVGLGAAIVFIGVTVLSPLIAQPVARLIGAPLPTISGVSGKLGRDNAMRNPKRTASTSAALMIGLGLVSFVAIFAASLKASANQALEQILKADYAVLPSSFSATGFSLDVAERLRSEKAFGAVSELRQGILGYQGGAQQVMAVDPSTLNDVEDVKMASGSVTDLRDGDVLVYRVTAESNGFRLGQTIPVQFARTGDKELKIVGILDDNRGLANYVITLGTFEQNFTEQLDAVVLLRTAPGVTQATAKAAADRVVGAFPNVKIQNQAELRESQASQINSLLALITALLGLAIFIALFGIVNTLALSIYERTHEIGLLRAVGMSRRQVRAMIRWEAVLIAVFGALLGIAVGAFFGWAMVQALSDQGIEVLAFPAGQLILYVVLAGIAGVLAAILPARKAARLDILRAITYE